MLFPLLLTSLQPDYLLTYRLEPRAVDRTGVTADVLVHPAATDEHLHEVTAFWAQVNTEDRAIIEAQQRGFGARRAAAACYASVEEGVHAFDRLVARALLEAP
jgi:phenylpropionate dioxygenase-like ring-hydroxylating dioxygenase large terminal subunit